MERDSYALTWGETHHPLTQTLTELNAHWDMALHDHGTSTAYVKVLIDQCHCHSIKKSTPINMLVTSLRKYDPTTTSPTKVIEVEQCKTNDTLAKIQVKYSIHTCKKVFKKENM